MSTHLTRVGLTITGSDDQRRAVSRRDTRSSDQDVLHLDDSASLLIVLLILLLIVLVGLGRLVDRHDFARKRRLRDGEGMRSEEDAVCGDEVARGEDDNISRYEGGVGERDGSLGGESLDEDLGTELRQMRSGAMGGHSMGLTSFVRRAESAAALWIDLRSCQKRRAVDTRTMNIITENVARSPVPIEMAASTRRR
jgi:hypothetical protein